MASNQKKLQKPKIAILHAFFKHDCKGGGEKLIFDIRDHYKADLYAGAISKEVWGKGCREGDSFVSRLWDDNFNFDYLHSDSKKPWRSQLKRQLYFLFSPKINKLINYDVVIFSGNIGFVPTRLWILKKLAGLSQKKPSSKITGDVNAKQTNKHNSLKKPYKRPKMVMYCHTPPRPITDQFEAKIKLQPKLLRPLLWLGAKIFLWLYKLDTSRFEVIVTNSNNTKNRLKKYTGFDSIPIYPAAQTDKFRWRGQGDYYLSFARLEKIKRIPMVLDAFEKMPDKKLIMASSGPLKDWVKQQIEIRNLKNVVYEGIVLDERLQELVGRCISGIYIPVDEDAGMTQIELMSAGKPVIGVEDGGLKETVIHGKTGFLIPKDPKVEDLVQAVYKMTPKRALEMKDQSRKQALKFSDKIFFEKMEKVL